jgi:peptidoglycan-N-acetylmuramic acid deacetylase
MGKLTISTLLIIFLCAAIVLALGVKGIFSSRPTSESMLSSTEYLWYYLPHNPNEPPRPIEKAKYLDQYDVLYLGPTVDKALYLTFDDCPNNDNIPKILDVLEKHGVSAAFFMTEDYIRKKPDVIRRIVTGGSLVCNHTASHVHVTGINFEKFAAELKGVEDAYREVTGQELPKFFRPPQGLFSEVTLDYTQRLGYTTVFWSFRYEDWDTHHQLSREQAYRIIMGETHPGEILLLHSQSSTNVNILDQLLTDWEKQGFTFRSIADIPRRADEEEAKRF